MEQQYFELQNPGRNVWHLSIRTSPREFLMMRDENLNLDSHGLARVIVLSGRS